MNVEKCKLELSLLEKGTQNKRIYSLHPALLFPLLPYILKHVTSNP